MWGASSTFQRLINNARMGINGTKAFVYLDNIIIFVINLYDHEIKQRKILARLNKFDL